MTRPQTHTYGFGTPSSRQPLLEAMLRAFAWLVSNVVSTCRTIFNRSTRDWHTDEVDKDQLLTPNDQQQEAQSHQPSFSGKAEGRIPGIPVISTQGTATYSRCATNQDARHKAEHDTRGYCRISLLVIPGEGAKRRRPGTQGLRTRQSAHPVPAFPLCALTRSGGNDIVDVRLNSARL